MATSTPNIGLQIPGLNQPNWQVPFNYDMNLLDLIFGGSVQVPALNVLSLVVGNLAATIAAILVSEAPAGSVPGSVFTLSRIPGAVIGAYKNGVFQRPALDYSVSGATLTFTTALSTGDTVWAVYLHS
jgi:hypothetical protein